MWWFQEIKRGRLKIDQQIRISKYAASKPPSKLGLKAGQRISLRYLIRAAAVKSANDAAAALAEAVSGSEAAFAKKMTATARAMGMSRTTFKNASGLTQRGHVSTARDMAKLGRQLFYDFPQYYNLFARRSTNAGVKTVYNTNRRLLNNYKGADGIKTGYTRAAGYNLVASARRGRERVIVSMFGGTSSAQRNAQVAKLMDLGFQRMPSRVKEMRPRRINPQDLATEPLVAALPKEKRGKVVIRRGGRVVAVSKSRRPLPRPLAEHVLIARAVNSAVEEIVETTKTVPKSEIAVPIDQSKYALKTSIRPRQRPAKLVAARGAAPKVAARAPVQAKQPVIEPHSAPGPRTGDWAVEIGAYGSQGQAEKRLLRVALMDPEALNGGKRQIIAGSREGRRVYRARFVGLTKSAAETACARMAARDAGCEMVGPGS